jgi:hypothetical protein
MNIEQLQEMWQTDCVIDDDRLDKEAVRTPNLHSKYLNILIANKLKLAKLKADYNTLRQKKFRYYRGEMSKQELEMNSWTQWQGAKPLKNEMEEFLAGDEDLNREYIKIEYISSIVTFCESILTQIKSRDFQIKSAIDWKKFISGA